MSTNRTHIYDEKVQPAPGVGEVGLEAIGHPFQEHLHNKDEGENFVSKLQDDFHGSSSFDVYVFKGLRGGQIHFHETGGFPKRLVASRAAYQSSAAEENHKNDECLKPVMLHNPEAGLAEVPPLLSFTLGDVHVQTRPPLHTVWTSTGNYR